MALPASDSFTRANSTDLGTDWTPQSGTVWGITSNEAALKGGTSDAGEYWNADTPDANQWTQAALGSYLAGNSWVGPAVRCSTSAQTRYEVVDDADERFLERVISGSFTTLDNDAASAAISGDVLYIEVTGSSPNINVTTKFNGSPDLSVTNDAPGSTLNTGRLGVGCGFSSIGGPSLDNWSGGNLATADHEVIEAIPRGIMRGTMRGTVC